MEAVYGLLGGYLAAGAMIAGFVAVIMKKHWLDVLFGAADIALTLLSIRGFRDMMIMSGKILTPELFGFGYDKPVLAVYVMMLMIGTAYVLVGAHGIAKSKRATVRT